MNPFSLHAGLRVSAVAALLLGSISAMHAKPDFNTSEITAASETGD